MKRVSSSIELTDWLAVVHSQPSSLWTLWFGNARQNWQFNKHFVCWPLLDGHNTDLASEGLRARSASFPTFASFILCGRNLGEDFPQGGAFAAEMATNAQVSRAAITTVFVAYLLPLSSHARPNSIIAAVKLSISLFHFSRTFSHRTGSLVWEQGTVSHLERVRRAHAQLRTHTPPLSTRTLPSNKWIYPWLVASTYFK